MTATNLARYDRMCDRATAQVIAAYSTSFALAAKALGQPERQHIRNIYAMVRIADELVDGTAAEAHECPETALDMYEEQVLHAPHHRFHTDPVLHAYARTHRECELDDAHVRAFFASMRADLTQTSYSAEELETYIYGSAEAIGLMCLAVFLRGAGPAPAERAARVRAGEIGGAEAACLQAGHGERIAQRQRGGVLSGDSGSGHSGACPGGSTPEPAVDHHGAGHRLRQRSLAGRRQLQARSQLARLPRYAAKQLAWHFAKCAASCR